MRTLRCDHLLSAAAELLDRAGPTAVTLRDVGRAVGVSHNAPYRHFESKQALLAALLARELNGVCDEAEGTEDPPSPRALTLAFASWALAFPERFRLLIFHWADADHDDLRRARRRWHDSFILAIRATQKVGSLPASDPEQLSCLIRATTVGAIQHYLAAGGMDSPMPESVIDDLFHYLEGAAQRGTADVA